jgi:hypothetical protein
MRRLNQRGVMTRKGSSQYIASVGPKDDAIIKGFRWLISEARNSGNEGVVAVSQKANLENIAEWSQLASVFNQLRSSESATLQDVKLNLLTRRNKKIYSFDGPILAIYGGQELLDLVDGISGTASVLYVPWGNDHKQWVQTWNANELNREPVAGTTDPEPTSGVVFYALETLTLTVNLGTGIVHSSDRENAIRVLETLYHKKASVTPELIRQQLIRLGWDPKNASDVEKLASTIWDGRRPKKSTGKADNGLWDYWNSKAI